MPEQQRGFISLTCYEDCQLLEASATVGNVAMEAITWNDYKAD